MIWGAHEVDGRIAARAAVKLRAALRQSIDAKRLYQLYKESDPLTTNNEAQDNARARAWAMINMLPNNQPLINALMFLWAEAFVLGEDSANDAIRQARELKKSTETGMNWDDYHPTKNPLGWRAGDRASALLITPPKAFQSLLSRSGVAIRGLDKTGYDRVGTALARSIRLGLGDTNAAKLINDAIGDPARALTIAITETNRAVSLGAMKTYREAGLEKMEWATSDPCPECAQNNGQIVVIGGTFNSGAQQPPAHPHCRCALLPVLPDYEVGEAGVVDIAPKLSERIFGGVSESDLLVFAEKYEREYENIPRADKIRIGDGRLRAAYDIKGYNALPKVVDESVFDEMAKTADAKVYRGISGQNAEAFAFEYKYGEHYAGLGIYGNGSYSSTKLQTANGYANRGALAGARTPHPNGAVMEILIPDTSKYVTYNQLKEKTAEMMNAIEKAKETYIKEYEQAYALAGGKQSPQSLELKAKYDALNKASSELGEMGTAATLLGYDGIAISREQFMGETYYVILNRGKVVVRQ